MAIGAPRSGASLYPGSTMRRVMGFLNTRRDSRFGMIWRGEISLRRGAE